MITFFLDNQQKIGNYLANKEALNSEMLHLMKQYQHSLAEKGQILNGVTQLLENTLNIVTIFREMGPVTVANDQT